MLTTPPTQSAWKPLFGYADCNACTLYVGYFITFSTFMFAVLLTEESLNLNCYMTVATPNYQHAVNCVKFCFQRCL